MLPATLHTALSNARAILNQSFVAFPTAIAIVIALVVLYYPSNLSTILAAWPFFTKRYDFLKENFQKTGRNLFSFKVLHVCI